MKISQEYIIFYIFNINNLVILRYLLKRERERERENVLVYTKKFSYR